jgi:hypothetical protein
VTEKRKKGGDADDLALPTIHSDEEDDSVSDAAHTAAHIEPSLHGRSTALTVLQTSESAGNEKDVDLSHFDSGKLSLGHVLTLSQSDSFDLFAPPIASSTPQELKQAAFAEEFKVQMQPVAMRPAMTDAARAGHAPGPSHGYEDLSLSEDEEEDGHKRLMTRD